MEAVRIVGLGLLSPLGAGVEANFSAMLAGEAAFAELTRFPTTELSAQRGGQLPPQLEAALRHDDDPYDDLALALLLAAGREALGEAPPPHELGLVLGTNFGLQETLTWCWDERLAGEPIDSATFVAQQDVLARAGAALAAHGPRAQLTLSCASGAATLQLAMDWLRDGRCRSVLAIAYDTLTPFCWTGLANLRTISPDDIRPFDESRNGTIFSEGAAAVLLTTDRARPALGYLAGTATNNNAFHLTAPSRGGAGSAAVVAAALRSAQLAPAEIGLVSAHATGTQANDPTECEALATVMGSALPEIPVCAFKSNLGHMLGAAGLAEVVVALQCLSSGCLPAVRGLTAQDPACAVRTPSGNTVGERHAAVTNSAGIGGNNAAAVITKRAPAAPTALTAAEIGVAAAGWVLPGAIGGGVLPALDPDSLPPFSEALSSYTVKPYVESTKGYLDPAAAYALGAAALCRRALGDGPSGGLTGLVAVTRYGAPSSAFAFYQQLVERGGRRASPMTFPHSYANTAANLVAIEFELSGPHLVLNADTPLAAAWHFASCRLRSGEADNMLLLAIEAVPEDAVPAGWPILSGAVCLWLRSGHAADRPVPAAATEAGVSRRGAVHELLAAVTPGT